MQSKNGTLRFSKEAETGSRGVVDSRGVAFPAGAGTASEVVDLAVETGGGSGRRGVVEREERGADTLGTRPWPEPARTRAGDVVRSDSFCSSFLPIHQEVRRTGTRHGHGHGHGHGHERGNDIRTASTYCMRSMALRVKPRGTAATGRIVAREGSRNNPIIFSL